MAEAPTAAQPTSNPAVAKVFTEPVPLTRPPLLIALALAAVLLSIGFYAVISAKVTTQVSSTGVLLSGGYATPAVASANGQVASLAVGPGDTVTPGQVIGQLYVSAQATVPLVAPVAGQVLQVEVRVGEVVAQGDPVVLLVNPSQPLVVTAFVPADKATALRPGQQVRVLTLDAGTNDPGFVPAELAGVQVLPVSQERVAQLLGAGSQSGVGITSGSTGSGTGQPLREITVTFPGDPLSPDQLIWQGTKPDPMPLGEGALVKVEVVTGEKSVISVLGSSR